VASLMCLLTNTNPRLAQRNNDVFNFAFATQQS
jgi:hypothetical protein